jgi:hypothetical protein
MPKEAPLLNGQGSLAYAAGAPAERGLTPRSTFLYFLPEPHGHGSLRPTFRAGGADAVSANRGAMFDRAEEGLL